MFCGQRHPLAEVSKSDVVIPNDFECGDVDGRVAVVTGPNQSGKVRTRKHPRNRIPITFNIDPPYLANSTRADPHYCPRQTSKSVYLKSIAACVFLAHVGSFVPADTADIPLFDRVFTRVASR